MTSNFRLFFLLLLLSGAGLLITSCDPDEPTPEDGELITTVTVTLTDTVTKEVITASFKDPDGPGGNDPTQEDAILLDANSIYTVSITFLDESKSPAVDVTDEIRTEGKDHVLCFTIAQGFEVGITFTDSDGSIPIGLETRWVTGVASDGNVRITLKHQPGVKDGTCDPGETDIEVDFWTIIQ